MGDTYQIAFDGGSKGNPGPGYGSFEIMRNGEIFDRQIEMKFGDNLTNNQAEYMSLIGALKSILQNKDIDPKEANIEIFGDSQLVIKQITGAWKVKHANMKPLWEEAQTLLKSAGSWKAQWHDRSNSVRILGH